MLKIIARIYFIRTVAIFDGLLPHTSSSEQIVIDLADGFEAILRRLSGRVKVPVRHPKRAETHGKLLLSSEIELKKQ
jgi:hypothetical protein